MIKKRQILGISLILCIGGCLYHGIKGPPPSPPYEETNIDRDSLKPSHIDWETGELSYKPINPDTITRDSSLATYKTNIVDELVETIENNIKP